MLERIFGMMAPGERDAIGKVWQRLEAALETRDRALADQAALVPIVKHMIATQGEMSERLRLITDHLALITGRVGAIAAPGLPRSIIDASQAARETEDADGLDPEKVWRLLRAIEDQMTQQERPTWSDAYFRAADAIARPSPDRDFGEATLALLAALAPFAGPPPRQAAHAAPGDHQTGDKQENDSP